MPMLEGHRKILIKTRPRLVDSVELKNSSLYSHMRERDLITQREEEEFREKPNSRQVELVLDAIAKKGKFAFDLFCGALIASHQKHIVEEILEPHLKDLEVESDHSGQTKPVVEVTRRSAERINIADVAEDGTSITLNNVEYTEPPPFGIKMHWFGQRLCGPGDMTDWVLEQRDGSGAVLKRYKLNKFFYSKDGFQVKLCAGIGQKICSHGQEHVTGLCYTGLDTWSTADNVTTVLVHKRENEMARYTKRTVYK